VYSYGVLLLEMTARRIPHQGLMENVESAAVNDHGRTGLGEFTEASCCRG
jgi:hypothetical protein